MVSVDASGLLAVNLRGKFKSLMSLLAIDVGNTNIVFGIFSSDALRVSWRLATLPSRTVDELWVLVSRFIAERGVSLDDIDGVVLSSVVPALTTTVSEMIKVGLNKKVLVVDAINAGLPIHYENPVEVGADRLVNSCLLYTSPSPRA